MTFVWDFAFLKFLDSLDEQALTMHLQGLETAFCGQGGRSPAEIKQLASTLLADFRANYVEKHRIFRRSPALAFHVPHKVEALEDHWSFMLYATQIPHVEGSPGLPNAKVKTPDRRYFENLVRRGLADIFTTPGEIIGGPSSLYLFLKIRSLRRLVRLFLYVPLGDARSLIFRFRMLIEPILEERGTEMVTLSRDKRNRVAEDFLQKCDDTLIERWGEKEFHNNLRVLSVDLRSWLRAR